MAVYVGGGGSGGGGGGSPVGAPTYYISTRGNDGTGNGSFESPYKTFLKLNTVLLALSPDSQPSASSPFVVIVENGRYDVGDNTDVFYPNCFYKGYGYGNTIIAGNAQLTTYTPANSLISDATSIIGLEGFDVLHDVIINLQSLNSYNNRLFMSNMQIEGDFSYQASGTFQDRINTFDNNIVGGTATFVDAVTYNLGLSYSNLGALHINSENNSPNAVSLTGITCPNSNFTALNGFAVNIFATACSLGFVELHGNETTLETDVASTPANAGLLQINNGTLSLINDAYGLAYTAATSSNWLSVPATVEAALDDLAGRGNFAIQPLFFDATLTPNGAYIVRSGGNITLTLPELSAGQSIKIYGAIGGWTTLNAAAQIIFIGNLIANTSITSGNVTDGIEIISYDGDNCIGIPTTGSALVVV